LKNGSRTVGQGFVEEIKIGDVGPPAGGLKKVDNRLNLPLNITNGTGLFGQV
jgi:hypothetical protein